MNIDLRNLITSTITKQTTVRAMVKVCRDKGIETIEDLYNYCNTQKENGVKLNKPMQDLFNASLTYNTNFSIQNNGNPIHSELYEFNISDIYSYYPEPIKKYTRDVLGTMYKSIGEFLDTDRESVIANFSNPTLNFVGQISELKDWLDTNHQMLLEKLTEKNEIIQFPLEYEQGKCLSAILKESFLEIADILNKRITDYNENNDLTYIKSDSERQQVSEIEELLYGIYRDHKTLDDIVSNSQIIKSKSAWYVKTRLSNFYNSLFYSPDYKYFQVNLKLRPEITKWYRSVVEAISGKFISYQELQEMIGECDESFVKFLGLDLLSVESGDFIVPKETKGIYQTICKCVINILDESVLPISKEEIIDQIKLQNDYQKHIIKKNKTYDVEFVDTFLDASPLISHNEDGYLLVSNKLSSTRKKAVRILYDTDKIWVSKSELMTSLNTKNPPLTQEEINKYGIYVDNRKKGDFKYSIKQSLNGPSKPIQERVREYAEQKIIFYYNDIKDTLLKENYSFVDKSLRTYITNVCTVDNKDHSHFCHKDYIDDYDFEWRSSAVFGIYNWILNQLKDILTNNESVTFDQFLVYAKNNIVNTPYANCNQRRFADTINAYAGSGQPFVVEGDKIRKNPTIFDKIDFRTIGFRGSYPHYQQIRDLAVNEIKRAIDNKLLLTEFVDLVKQYIDSDINRSLVERAIQNTKLPEINVELQTINGTRFLILKNDIEIQAEPVYEITSSNQDDETIAEINNEKSTREPVSYQFGVNWEQLSKGLKIELKFYDRWLSEEGFDIKDGVDKFIEFIKDSENSNLNSRLPLSLCEYLFAETNKFDRANYLSNIVMFYEGLLADIYYRNTGILVKTKGLVERAASFPEILNVLTNPYERYDAFDRCLAILYKQRNKYAHGVSVDLSSQETAKYLSDFTALYIYTILKYLEPVE